MPSFRRALLLTNNVGLLLGGVVGGVVSLLLYFFRSWIVIHFVVCHRSNLRLKNMTAFVVVDYSKIKRIIKLSKLNCVKIR